MPPTPRRANRKPREQMRFLSQVFSDNVKKYRGLQGFSQQDIARRMKELGHDWSRVTLSEVERGGRHVNIDELGALALVLGRTVGDLLDPLGPDRTRTGIDLGGPLAPLSPGMASLWVRDRAVLSLQQTETGFLKVHRELFEHQLHPSSRGALRALQVEQERAQGEWEEEQDLVPLGYDPEDRAFAWAHKSDPRIESIKSELAQKRALLEQTQQTQEESNE